MTPATTADSLTTMIGMMLFFASLRIRCEATNNNDGNHEGDHCRRNHNDTDKGVKQWVIGLERVWAPGQVIVVSCRPFLPAIG